MMVYGDMETDHMKEKKIKNKLRLCPISHRDCRQCALYRGKHIYLNVCKGAPGAQTNWILATGSRKRVGPKSAKRLSASRISKSEIEALPNITIKAVDAETEESKYYDLKETEKWDWNDSTLTRISEDTQVNSWEDLVEIARSRAKSGYRELVVRIIPRYMLIESTG
jgi:hypothetical protein